MDRDWEGAKSYESQKTCGFLLNIKYSLVLATVVLYTVLYTAPASLVSPADAAQAANGAVFRADYNLTNDSSDEHQDTSNILFSTLLEKT